MPQAQERIRPFWIAVKNYIDQGLQDKGVAPAEGIHDLMQVHEDLKGGLGKFAKAHGLPSFMRSYAAALRKTEDDAFLGWRPTEKDIRKLLKVAGQPTLSAFIATYAPQESAVELPRWMQEITVDCESNSVNAKINDTANGATAYTLRLGYADGIPDTGAVHEDIALVRGAFERALKKANVSMGGR